MKFDHQTVPGELNFSTRTTVILVTSLQNTWQANQVAAKI
uniref:Uncharacterized protein n=1 Tax=Anguilla anguilla TaxID=7936 RepID=A0A0E9SJ36_ANGAN